MAVTDEDVARHWSHGSLEQAIRDGLLVAGVSPDRVRPDDLAPVDEFHMGGREATVHLAEQMGLGPRMSILDIGCGIGGPARFFAGHYGCSAVGIDVTPEYIAVAEALTRMTALAAQVTFRVGSATALPFEESCFDAATLIHVGMNIPDKDRLCAEAARVLRPGGVFGIYEVVRTGEGEIKYPVPWADTAALSFLATSAAYRQALERAGFAVVTEEDRRAFALDFFHQARARLTGSKPPPLGIHIHMGPTAPAKIANVIENLEKGLIAPFETICRRP